MGERERGREIDIERGREGGGGEMEEGRKTYTSQFHKTFTRLTVRSKH